MSFKVIKNCLVIKPTGEIDSHYADILKKEIDEAIYKTGVKNIIFDFSSVDFMDSSGIGLVAGRYKYTLRTGGITAAACVNSRLMKIMTLSGLLKIIPVKNSVEECVAIMERGDKNEF
jgi:stage II sporulation protein AA (anti-sigma F factor antagonist)